MASAQVMNKNDKQQKAIVEQMVEKAKSFAFCEQNFSIGNDLKKSQAGATVSMYNDTQSTMNLMGFHEWSGKSIKPIPSTIKPNSSVEFSHMGIPPNGSSAAVLYFGKNKLGMSCGWVLAWSAPTDPSESTPNKVYVECGPSSDYACVDWSAIHANLNASSDNSGCINVDFRIKGWAKISAQEGYAAVGAYFGEV